MTPTDAILRHIESALDGIEVVSHDWPKVIEGAALAAERQGFTRLAGLCRGAPASPSREARQLIPTAQERLTASSERVTQSGERRRSRP